MNFADVAPSPSQLLPGAAICAGLSCLFLASAALLVLVLVRRSRRKKTPPAA